MASLLDSDYSSDVSLSRILDKFIDDEEQPETILAFLHLHENDIDAIIGSSILGARLFQLDFALKCNLEKIIDLLNIIKKSKSSWMSSYGAYLCWQILRSKSEKSDMFKTALRSEFNKIITSRPHLRHPYRYGCAHHVELFDDMISLYCTSNEVAENVARWSAESLKKYYTNIEWSLFARRMLQYDVIGSLPDIMKYVALNSIEPGCMNAEPLCVQLLDSSEHIDVKLKALDIFSGFNCVYAEGTPEREILDCKSFSQMMMKSTLIGEFDMKKIAIDLIRNARLDVLRDWIAYDKDSFESCINASDIVEYLINRKDNAQS